MPPNLVGAHVPVFVGAPDHEAAAQLAVFSLTKRGFEFLDITDGKIHELDPVKWDAYVREAWPEFVDHFPRQKVVLDRLESEFLFTGPFAGYEAAKDA